MTHAPVDTEHEWLEADGLGGFASAGGCLFQAWSVAELLRVDRDVLDVGEHRSQRSA